MNKNSTIVVFIILLLLIGGYFVFRQNGLYQSGQTATTTGTGIITPTPTPTPNPTPTPTPSSTSAQNAGIPIVQTNQTAIPSNSTAILMGNVVPNGAPTTYWYEYGTTNGLGTKGGAQSIGSGFSSIQSPGYIKGLSAHTTYYYRLSALNRYGTVNGVTYSFSTNSNPPPVINPPTASTNSATNVDRTTATLNGNLNAKGADTNYWFEYGVDTNFGTLTQFKTAGNGTDAVAVSESLTDLHPLTKYYYRINAQNQFGTVNGATSSFTTKGPASPGVPTVSTSAATNVGSTTVRFNGKLNPNGDATNYWFEYSVDSLLGSILGTATGSQTLDASSGTVSVTADANDLSKNTKYYVRLVGKNQYGTVRGSIVSFTTKP